jgi:hypothetical protein
MGHSWSVAFVRSSVPGRRAAVLPSAMRRRIVLPSHEQLSYKPDGLQRVSSSARLRPSRPFRRKAPGALLTLLPLEG